VAKKTAKEALEAIRLAIEVVAPEIRLMSGSSRDKLREAYKLSKADYTDQPPTAGAGPGNRELQFTKSTTIEEAKHDLLNNIRSGVVCPVCGRIAKQTRKIFSTAMAYWIVWLVKVWFKKENWVSVNDGPLIGKINGGDFEKLVYWNLMERKDSPKLEYGYCRPTRRGISFVRGELEIYSHVVVYDDQARGFVGRMITIQEALGPKYDYDKLMKGV